MDITKKKTLYLAAGVDVVHIGIQDDLEHHARVIGAATDFTVQTVEAGQVKVVHYRTHDANRIAIADIFINPLRKKYQLVGNVIPKV